MISDATLKEGIWDVGSLPEFFCPQDCGFDFPQSMTQPKLENDLQEKWKGWEKLEENDSGTFKNDDNWIETSKIETQLENPLPPFYEAIQVKQEECDEFGENFGVLSSDAIPEETIENFEEGILNTVRDLNDNGCFNKEFRNIADPEFRPPKPEEKASIWIKRVRNSGRMFFNEFPPEMTTGPFKYELQIFSTCENFDIESSNDRVQITVERRRVYRRYDCFEIRCVVQLKASSTILDDRHFRFWIVESSNGTIIGHSSKILVRSKRLDGERNWWDLKEGRSTKVEMNFIANDNDSEFEDIDLENDEDDEDDKRGKKKKKKRRRKKRSISSSCSSSCRKGHDNKDRKKKWRRINNSRKRKREVHELLLEEEEEVNDYICYWMIKGKDCCFSLDNSPKRRSPRLMEKSYQQQQQQDDDDDDDEEEEEEEESPRISPLSPPKKRRRLM